MNWLRLTTTLRNFIFVVALFASFSHALTPTDKFKKQGHQNTIQEQPHHNKHNTAHAHEHGMCIHDMMVDRHNKPSTVNKQAKIARDALRKDESKRDALAATNVRIKIDTSLLDSDVYKCTSAGQSVTNAGSTYSCQSDDVLTSDKKSWLTDTLLPQAEAILEAALLVEPLPASVGLESSTCGFDEGFAVPSEYASNFGATYDIVIFVTARPIAVVGVLAFGGECEQEDGTRRAIAGQLNYSPSSLKVNERLSSQLGTTLHEITHVLGFSKGKWSQFYDRTGDTTIPKSEVIQSVSIAGKTTELMITPRVVDFVRAHFGCPTLDGAELEDGGTSGTAGSHWEKRTFFNEFMTGSSSSDPVFSELTLRMFEDAGWYVAFDADWVSSIDASLRNNIQGDLIFGRAQGCDFAELQCDASGGWPRKDTYPGYFCTEELEEVCAFDLRSKARCGIETWSPAPESQFRYFGANSAKGGLSSLADYCPYYSPSDFCTDTSNSGVNGQEFCADCRCFESSLTDIELFENSATKSLGCYKSACQNKTEMLVAIDNVFYNCPAGEEISVDGMTGTITCPFQAVITAVCQEAEPSVWPVILSVEPTEGGPGTVVTITGFNFDGDAKVTIDNPAVDVQVTGDHTIVCTLVESEACNSPPRLLNEKFSVIVENADGKKVGLANGFEIKSEFNLDLLSDGACYCQKNPIYCAMFACVLLCGVLTCIYCCCSGGKERDSKRQSYNDANLYR